MSWWKSDRPQLLLSFASGLVMGLTLPPANLWPLAWVALAPLWVLLRSLGQSRSRSWGQSRSVGRSRALLGFVWGIGYHGLGLSWIGDLHPLMWLGVPWLASVTIVLVSWAIITLLGAASVALWAWLLGWLSQDVDHDVDHDQESVDQDDRPPPRCPVLLRVLIGVALWCAIEFIRNLGPLDWTTLALTQSPHNLLILHLGQLSGTQLVSGAIVLVNGLLAEAWLQRGQSLARSVPSARSARSAPRFLVLVLVAFLGCHGIGLALYSRPLADTTSAAINIGIVQGNIPTRTKFLAAGVRQTIENYTQGYNQLVDRGVDAVLTPEGTFPWVWLNTPRQRDNALYQAILDRGVPTWIGTIGQRFDQQFDQQFEQRSDRTTGQTLGQQQITQSLFMVSGTGKILSRYDKVKLVPLGEYIPFQATLGQFISRLSPVEASMVPGRSQQQVATPFGQAIVGICFDSAFSGLFRQQAAFGGEFILTASNNDPYGAAMMAQHHAQDVMRSIETDRWAARATNTGFSGIVDPHGRTIWLSGFRTYETHAEPIYRRRSRTLYVQLGDWFTPIAIVGALVARIGLR